MPMKTWITGQFDIQSTCVTHVSNEKKREIKIQKKVKTPYLLFLSQYMNDERLISVPNGFDFFFHQDKQIRNYGVTEALEDNVGNWTETPTLQGGV